MGGGFAPIMDTWFQSETGSQVIAPCPSPRFQARLAQLPPARLQCAGGRRLWPSSPSRHDREHRNHRDLAIHASQRSTRDPARYSRTYWSAFPGRYHSGDKARVDEDGYIWALGRETMS